jgi:hypothetical protein
MIVCIERGTDRGVRWAATLLCFFVASAVECFLEVFLSLLKEDVRACVNAHERS